MHKKQNMSVSPTSF